MTTHSPARSDASLQMWVRALERVAPIALTPSVTLPSLIGELADRFETAPALLADGSEWSYRALAQQCNRYAGWALAEGLGKGDVVGLLMPNCPDYLAIWLGLAGIGVTVALVNTNLAGSPLAHSINIVAPSRIIVAEPLIEAVVAVLPQLAPGLQCWTHGANRHRLPRIDVAVASIAGAAPQDTRFEPPSINDRALYIYTSGTTGLPKAASVSHYRLMQWGHWFAGMMNTAPGDRMYNCLPLYHSIGGIVATGALLVSGGSIVIRPGFSARRFWHEVSAWDCTLFQYIGELCRYLVNTPPHPREAQHRIRLCCGNGLRPDVWEKFQSRFRIPQILEFYAATEANFSLYNCDGKPGAIGRIPPFLAHRFPVVLVRSDPETGEPVRGSDGLCVRCTANQTGEAISEIRAGEGNLTSRFEGYTDPEAADKKILRNVFAPGDTWYRSGDLMRKDEAGYYYFVDRIGDTYRWKGENVSTMEVAETVAACPGVIEAIVYGVPVAGTEGRAGMAAVTVTPAFDITALQQHLAQHLPEYARPLFVRICPNIETTGTFKPNKQRLVREGYNPSLFAEPVYFYDRAAGEYTMLDAAFYDRILQGDVRL